MDREQTVQLERVRSRIGQAVLEFCRQRGIGAEFHADELRRHVLRTCPAAPGSSDRILRELRRDRLVNYEVVSRKQSLYRLVPVSPEYTGVLF